MKPQLWLATAILATLPATSSAQPDPKTLIKDLKNPESVAVGRGGKIYVSCIGEFGKDGDGGVYAVEGGKAVPFCTGLDDPKGLVAFEDALYVADKTRVLRIGPDGKAAVFAAPGAFPAEPQFLNDITVEARTGNFFVTDSGDLKGNKGAIYQITKNGKVSLVLDHDRWPDLHTPNGVVPDGEYAIIVLDFGTGKLHRVRLADKKTEQLAAGFEGGDGLTWDMHGRLFVTRWTKGEVSVIPRPGLDPVKLPVQLDSAADLCLGPDNASLLVPDMKAGKLVSVPVTVPGREVNTSPLPVETELAFPKLKWTGWTGETPQGTFAALRPIVLTHAGDGSGRVFVATQRGVIHTFPNDPEATETKVFLDIEKLVRYKDSENEEGFLGLAFHPKFKDNGEFFVFHTVREAGLTNVLARFKVSKDDPDRADPDSREELLRVKRPFWNHDGGTIAFGPDGYLYVALGDGGAANDPYNNAQNLDTLLGSILRIDVDRKEDGRNYAIPKDNPFVGKQGTRPEIWAYGLRNVWRMAFDRETGKLWAADVGQNLFEEIDLIEKGGNYGWKLREGLHPFSDRGVGVTEGLIDPIWEYHHDIGKSITGGLVYRGRDIPGLRGHYVYGDYVTQKIWALRYDPEQKRVAANHTIPDRGVPILSFGEDDRGEMYLLTESLTGQGIYRFVPSKR